MTSYIYTISHPFTDQIVYVGCTSNLEKRTASYIRQKKVFRPIDKFIVDLRDNFMYPKIEVIAETDSDNCFEEEMFWIRILKSWGFDLLNVFKVNPPNRNLYETHKSAYNGIPKIRKSRVWEDYMFELGYEFEIKKQDRNHFYITFKYKAKKMEKYPFLKFTQKGDDILIATVVDKKPENKEKIIRTFKWPSGLDRKKHVNNKEHLYEPLKQVGGVIELNISSIKSQISHYLKDIKPKRMNYKILENGNIQAIRIY